MIRACRIRARTSSSTIGFRRPLPRRVRRWRERSRMCRRSRESTRTIRSRSARSRRWPTATAACRWPERAFARTLELDPDRPGIRQNYGKLLRELERYGESERELRIALAQTTRTTRERA